MPHANDYQKLSPRFPVPEAPQRACWTQNRIVPGEFTRPGEDAAPSSPRQMRDFKPTGTRMSDRGPLRLAGRVKISWAGGWPPTKGIAWIRGRKRRACSLRRGQERVGVMRAFMGFAIGRQRETNRFLSGLDDDANKEQSNRMPAAPHARVHLCGAHNRIGET